MELKRLKLTQLKDVELCKEEQKQIIGGATSCGCGCNGPSSSTENAFANWDNGYSESGGGNNMCASWGDYEWKANF